MKCSTIALCLLSSVVPASCAVEPGDPAPPIHLDSLVPDRPVPAVLETLKGKAVVLEFWATWCGPCVGAIPHLNELADRFAGRPVQFLSVTDEEPALVERFLKARPIHGLVGIDHGNSMFHAYGFGGWPQTVLVAADGKLAAIRYPASVRVSDIEDLLAGRPLTLSNPSPGATIVRAVDDPGPAPLVEMIVRPGSGTGQSMSAGGNSFQVTHYSLRELLAAVYQIDFHRLVGESVVDPSTYDVSLKMPQTRPDTFQRLLPDWVCLAFHVTTRKETRETAGWTLSAPKGNPSALKEAVSAGSSFQSGGGKVQMIGMTLKSLASMAGSMLGKPVEDRTGLSGRFDLELTYDAAHPESILASLRSIGFALEPATVKAEFLVVTKE